MIILSRKTRGLVLAGLLTLSAVLLPACTDESAPQDSAKTSSVLEDGTYELRVDRRGGTEDSAEAFGFLPEASYQAIEDGPTYRAVISDQGSRVLLEGVRGSEPFTLRGERSSTTDDQAWYELTDAFAGGRFVAWRNDGGLQGELTIYGSGRPIIFSERGVLTASF